MKRWLLSLLLLIPCIAKAQSNVAGLLYASNFATWTVPQGNVGQMSWSAPSFCTVTSGGTTFRAFSVGTPIMLVDAEVPANSEVITPIQATYNGFSCSISAAATHPHRSFYFTSATAGLGEALSFAGTQPYQIILTPDWQRLGGTTGTITAAKGNTSVTILDQRTSQIVPYSWSGSAYVAGSFGGGGLPGGTGVVKVTSGTGGLATTADIVIPSPGSGVSQTISQQNGTQLHLNNVTLFGGTLADSITSTPFNKVVYETAVSGTGIGQLQAQWAASTYYPQCQSVYIPTVGNWIEVAELGDSVTTPGTNSAIWYPIANGTTPTKGDCAYYIAAAGISSGTGTVTNGTGAALVLPPGEVDLGIGWLAPTVPVSGNPGVSIFGQGKAATFVVQSALKGDGNCMLEQPLASSAYQFASYVWEGFTLNANFNAPCVMGVYGSQQFAIKNIALLNAADGSDHYAEFGNYSNTGFGWSYEADLEDIDISTYHGSGSGAVITASVSGGAPTFTVSNGGSGYKSAYVKLILSSTGSNADIPCSSRGTDTITVSGGTITSITSTASGCASTLYASIYGNQNVAYGMKFSNFTDSKMISSLTDGGVGATAGFEASNITSMNQFYKVHPINTYIGVQDSGNNDWVGTQMDSEYRYAFDFQGATNMENIYGTKFEWNSSQLLGSSDYHFGQINGTPINSPYAINIYGDVCGNQANFNGYNHFLTPQGSVDATSNGIPSFVHVHETNYCNHVYPTTSNYANFIGSQFSMSPGFFGNVWNFVMSPAAGGAQSMTVNNPLLASGGYTWNFTTNSAATSGNNYGSPAIAQTGNYWNSSASAPFAISSALTFASGANPLATYTVGHAGTAPSGGAQYTWDSSWVVKLPSGTQYTSADLNTAIKTLTGCNTANYAYTPQGGDCVSVSGGAGLASNIFTGTQTAPSFNLQSGAAGPYVSYFDDFFSNASVFSTLVGSASGSACATNNNTWQDQNHPGNLSVYSGTASSGTGTACTVGSSAGAPQIVTPNSSLGWTWESVVEPVTLPGSIAGSLQAGMASAVNVDPWTTGIGFYLSSANGTANDWYCRYGTTSTDSTVAATTAWTRLTIVSDGTNVHWYIGGTQVCGTGVAVGSMPAGPMLLGYSASLYNGTPTASRLVADYLNFTRAVTR